MCSAPVLFIDWPFHQVHIFDTSVPPQVITFTLLDFRGENVWIFSLIRFVIRLKREKGGLVSDFPQDKTAQCRGKVFSGRQATCNVSVVWILGLIDWLPLFSFSTVQL